MTLSSSPRQGGARRQPTMGDVAQHAKVSSATVSRVLNNLPVNPSTRAKVLRAVEELGYVANTHARALAGARTKAVAVVLHDAISPAFNAIVRGVQQQASADGRLCLTCVIDGDPEAEIDAVTEMGAHSVDAVMLVGRVSDSPDHLERTRRLALTLDAAGSRLVLCGRPAPGDDLPITVVEYDNEGGAFAAASHLLAHGHERILFLGGQPGFATTGERLAGLRRALQTFGREHHPELVEAGPMNHLFGYRKMRALLSSGLNATAVMAANDATAAGAMHALHEAGLDIPNDFSVVGYDDVWIAEQLHPALTTVHVPWEDAGRTAVRLALHRDPDLPGTDRVMLGTHLVVRESVATAH